IAKILNPEIMTSQGESLVTLGPAMTPEYASPEQLSGGAATEASDVYSLGVLLYQLLAHERPAPRLSGDIREHTPPSGTERGRGLHRDLDRIVLKAIEQQPAKRYASAAAFEADLRRYLEGLPVQAGRTGLLRRSAKLLGRHKGSAAAALLGVAAAGTLVW